ncbi:DENN domain-containing protein 3-like [Leucoraja erinacea]|uniref:DENN domain-containing protein 3-like n=1 Tax=Leucoraja erinaceus TaxID=7782 RepID=UPI002458A1CF|nr:DENN domain-containing protein 3-like [Leucoraja erinacea]
MDGTVVVWDPVTMESCSQLQLQQCCYLSAISMHQCNLWCCADQSLVMLSWDGQQLQKVTHGLTPDGGSVPWSHFLILPQRDEVWVLSSPRCSLYVWSMRCLSEPVGVMSLPSSGHCMVHVKEQVWVGGAAPDGGGRIQVVSAADRSLVKELEASGGPVTALCCAHDRYMLSASATGQASIWSVD